MQHKINENALLIHTDKDIQLESNIMSSSFINNHLSSNDLISNSDDKKLYHKLEISPHDFHNLEINFYPGFAQRNSFLGHFKSKHKSHKHKTHKPIYNDQTPLPFNDVHTQHNIDTLSNTIHSLSQIPVGSRLRYINFTDCEDMLYANIMTVLASELVQCQTNIILKFEDVSHIQQKVKNSSGAVMAWHVKQQTLGVNFSKSTNHKHLCIDCSHITHSCVRDIVDSWYITLLVFAVIFYDLSIIFYTESHRLFWNWNHSLTVSKYEQDLVMYLTLLALVLYMIEIGFRVYGYGKHFRNGTQILKQYRKRSCNCLKYIYGYLTRGFIEFIDSFVIIVSFVLTIVDITYIDSDNLRIYIQLPFVYEILRFIRVSFRILFQLKYTPKCIRLIVRVNRQTYFDNNFDLDLCYIVYPRYLVMSWPSQGIESLYRNPLGEVAKFLNKYHCDNYLIFDLCAERSYDDMLFKGRVMRSRAMNDHGVCSLSDMFEFAQLVHLYLRHNPIHCAVIHCKGGKGRTGLMVCACLMYDYRDTTVDEALEYFATMRTNITKRGKLQGVEGPSQLRYCKYFYQLLHITDVLKLKSNNKRKSSADSVSVSKNTKNFYNMVIAASPQQQTGFSLNLTDSDSDTPRLTEECKSPLKSDQIIDDTTRIKIAKHLDSDDLNISGLKQNKHKRSSIVTPEPSEIGSSPYLSERSNGSQRKLHKTSDVGISQLNVDKTKLFVRGQWETSNPSLQSMLLLHQRFETQKENKEKETQNSDKNLKLKNGKKKHRRQKSSEAWLERQRDSTVMAQSLAVKSPKKSEINIKNPKIKVGQYSDDLGESDSNESAEELNDIISNDMHTYMKCNPSHFVSVNNESYLSELFLKQSVSMKLKYVRIGPFDTDEWHNKAIDWRVDICLKRDFDYSDEMKVFEFRNFQTENAKFHKMKFTAFENVNSKILSLNGNICVKIYRCKKEGTAVPISGEANEKMIGSVWIHSHFIPANYKKQIETLVFTKSEIDGMYKDKKHKTSIPQSFQMEIGYRCSRVNHNSNNSKVKIAHV